jgi:putative serine protease PepD
VEAEAGALVAEVEPNGPAASAGIQVGDIVTALGEQEVRGSGDLLSALRRYEPGERVEVAVLREGTQERISLRLGEREG